MYRVAAAYAVVAWILLQLVNNLAPGLNLPSWAVTLVIVLLAVGFPIAMLFCWIQHMPSEDGASAQTKTAKVDWVLIGALIAVLAAVSYQQIASTSQTNTASRAAGTPASTATQAGISIAVLPFTNLSGDNAQEFFSDGITEEITSALAKVPNLQMVGRISTFQFKGQNKDLPRIRDALNARYLIDGSVRKVGDRVRITAQLIQADNGLNVWTDNYDRQLTDIFAIQEEIAQAIATSLRVPLGLQQGERLVSNRTNDLASYDAYLRAKGQFRARLIDETVAILEPLIARDPSFAPAWALLARSYALQPFFGPVLRQGSLEDARRVVESSLDKAVKTAREAVRLDPRSASSIAAMAYVEGRAGHWAASEDLSRQALALDPNDAEFLDAFSQTQTAAGRIKEAASLRERMQSLEPFVPLYATTTAEIVQINGQYQTSIQILEAVPTTAGTSMSRSVYLARAYAATGRFGEAADALLSMSAQKQVSQRSIEDAARLLRAAPTKTSDPKTLPNLEGELNFAYVYAGAPERVLEYAERAIALKTWMNATAMRVLWLPEFAPVRKTERFKAVLRNAGLVDYWRARGWPDLCKPVGADDFQCE